jgi:hypothetical protein
VPDEDKRALHAVFTMDVLPAGGSEEVSGPERWDDAERAVGAFAEVLAEEGFDPCYFVAPEALKRLADTVRDVYLGSYSFDRQREIIELAGKTWADALGEAPESFRPGFFSANDYTFHVLCMEGYHQGSCSLPGRMDNDQCSLWFPSYPFPHHTDPLDRTVPGTMEFYEVPVTSDFEAATHISYETYTPPYLRIEQTDLHDYARDLVKRQLDRMQEDQVEVRAVTFVTSNIVGWGRADDPHVEKLENLCAMLREVAEERGMDLRPATLESLHEEADRIHRAAREMEPD